MGVFPALATPISVGFTKPCCDPNAKLYSSESVGVKGVVCFVNALGLVSFYNNTAASVPNPRNVEEVCRFPDLPFRKPLTYQAKQLIAREIQVEKMRQMEAPRQVLPLLGKPPGTAGLVACSEELAGHHAHLTNAPLDRISKCEMPVLAGHPLVAIQKSQALVFLPHLQTGSPKQLAAPARHHPTFPTMELLFIMIQIS